MKTIDYKQIKSINNYIPKYDLGTKPIDRGYQIGNLTVGFGSIDKQADSADPMTKALVLLNWSNLVTSGTLTGYLIYNGFVQAAARKAAKAAPASYAIAGNANEAVGPSFGVNPVGGTLSEEAVNNAAGTITKSSSSALSSAATAMNIAGAVLGTGLLAYGIYDQTKNGVSNSDIEQMAGQSTQYVGNTAYKTYSGLDKSGLRKYINALNTGSTINNVLSGAGAGASIGTMALPGIGTAIGAGVGALVGGVGSWFGWNKSKHAQQRRINNAIAQYDAYNMQSESEAASKEMRNNFYTADYGMEGQDKVFGNKIDEDTGLTFAQEAALLGAPTVPVTSKTPRRKDNVITEINGEPALVGGGEAIVRGSDPTFDYLAMKQSMTPDNNPNPYNMTRKLKNNMLKYAKRYDAGTMFSVLPAMLGTGVGLGLYFSYKKDKPTARESYVENPNSQRALDELYSLRYDPRNSVTATNDATRLGQYAINTSPYSSSQRMSLLSQLYGDRMKNIASIYDLSQQLNNEYRTAAAQAAIAEGLNVATRRQQSRQYRDDMYAKAVATRRRGMEQGWANALAPIYSMFSNLNNNYWTNENIRLYQQKLLNDKQATLASIYANANNGRK